MPSLPDVAVLTDARDVAGVPAAAPALAVAPAAPSDAFQPIDLGGRSATATLPGVDGRVGGPRGSWSFEQAFPRTATPATPATPAMPAFEVSDRVGIPAALLTEARREAREQGHAAGLAAGRAEAQRRAAQDDAARAVEAARVAESTRLAVERALTALDAAGAELGGRTALALAGLEQLVLDSAFTLAEAIVGATLRDDEQRGLAAVRRALALVPAEADGVSVALHPSDLAVVTAAAAAPAGVVLLADPTLCPGDAVARAGDTTVEARLDAALNRAREVLGR